MATRTDHELRQMTPDQSPSAEPVLGLMLRTEFGWIAAAARRGRLLAVTFPEAAAHRAEGALPADYRSPDPLLTALADDLRRYFAGEPVSFSHYPVDLDSQPLFRRAALLAARRIPYGHTWTYARLAAEVGNFRAARAAGQAMARNPLPFVVPCHRVIASDGTPRGFGGGLDLKRFLLELERTSSRPGKAPA
jgi:methylated-DNA-[protein]-cysteine S-methyltransferase